MQEITRSRGLWKGLLLAMLVPLLVYAYEFGPPSGYTGGFNEPNCTECHFGTAVNTGGGNVRITLPATYASGATVPVTVTITDATASRWGFELSARTQEGKQAGTLIPGTDRFTQLQTPLAGIQYIEHTLNGTRPGTRNSQTFNFTWTAPNTSAGPVIFNVSANAANNNNLQTGDKIYTSNGTVQPEAAGPTPAVPDNAVVNNASFAAGTNALAPGTIAAIFGSDLNDGTSNPFSSFSNGKLLTTLGGASVTFNGIAAPMFSSFSTQLNVQIPFELAGSTSASVVVTVAGKSSPPKTVPIGSVLPGIFSTTSDGKGQGAIQIANTTIFAAPAGSIAGVQTRPANRGEFLTIFCTGLGAVSNPPATGAPAGGSPPSTTITLPQVTIGGIPAQVSFAGLSPGFVGLYQVNVPVPQGVAAGNAVEVVLSMGEVKSNTVTIAVAP